MEFLENLSGIGQRLVALRAKLKAREGKKEFKENCKAIRAEIERLEALAEQKRRALASGQEADKGSDPQENVS